MARTTTYTLLAKSIEHTLSATYDSPQLCQQYAWWIIESLFGLSQTHLIAKGSVTLDTHHEAQLTSWLDQLTQQHMPIAYLIGSVPFGPIAITVRPPTLIPRPETEEWCLALIDQLKKIDGPLRILDLCTGSGCIALALAHALPNAVVYAVDIADSALLLCTENKRKLHIKNVFVLKSDLFTQMNPSLSFDIIVSNPPYIDEREWHSLDTSVTHWEDKRALIAPEHGLAIIKRIIHGSPDYLRPHPQLARNGIAQLIMEIGHEQAAQVVALMKTAQYNNIQVIKDLAGKDRIVCGRVDNVAEIKKTK